MAEEKKMKIAYIGSLKIIPCDFPQELSIDIIDSDPAYITNIKDLLSNAFGDGQLVNAESELLSLKRIKYIEEE